MVIKLDIEIWEIGKGSTKRGDRKRGKWGKWYGGAAGFCGPCVSLGIYLL
jgi:hypothetical protein